MLRRIKAALNIAAVAVAVWLLHEFYALKKDFKDVGGLR